jgi:hypothetical protein
MTKKLSELFELPEDVNDPILPKTDDTDEAIASSLSNLEKIESALPAVRGLEAADDEMDDMAALAKDSYTDLMELGMQVDPRFAAEIFNSAGTFLGHAITAKTAKINKKLKMIDLQLKKLGLDQKAASTAEEIVSVPTGTGRSLDRNELLKMLAGKSSPE